MNKLLIWKNLFVEQKIIYELRKFWLIFEKFPIFFSALPWIFRLSLLHTFTYKNRHTKSVFVIFGICYIVFEDQT